MSNAPVGQDASAPEWQRLCAILGWLIFVIALLVALQLVLTAVAWGVGSALGAGAVSIGEAAEWSRDARITLVAAILTIVLGWVARRWVLVAFSVLLAGLAFVMSVGQVTTG
ncbi:hypothetical protein [Microcella humidisoli]|uniref:MFS transporter n=1 Tax=Microcella humidisoli TaxID=2963406 RepID=A0ABY5FUR4_9MICO|nr:hypothetical protein [Microcella humidisoli]UTT62049.1 hypothetical protein NNL39_10270 [Microcella humidisoli]